MTPGAALPRPDPVRQSQIEALERRAVQHQGQARRLIEARAQQLRAQAAPQGQGQGLGVTPAVAGAAGTAGSPSPASPSPLAHLLAYIAQHAAPGGELRAVQGHRATWARLSMDQRLVQTLAQVPDQAGPLNTQRLLHQALTVMRTASPGYLQQFMQHVDSLLALDTLGPAPLASKRDSSRQPKAR